MPNPSAESTLPEIVSYRLPSGGLRYLLEAHQETCDHCHTGVRTVSFWISLRGRGEHIAWCGYCFNAICEPAPLNDEHRERVPDVLAAVSAGRASSPYPAVRPALEDLERRGLL